MYLDICFEMCIFLYLRDITCITITHILMSAGVCFVAHGTEEGLIPKNVLQFCTIL